MTSHPLPERILYCLAVGFAGFWMIGAIIGLSGYYPFVPMTIVTFFVLGLIVFGAFLCLVWSLLRRGVMTFIRWWRAS